MSNSSWDHDQQIIRYKEMYNQTVVLEAVADFTNYNNMERINWLEALYLIFFVRSLLNPIAIRENVQWLVEDGGGSKVSLAVDLHKRLEFFFSDFGHNLCGLWWSMIHKCKYMLLISFDTLLVPLQATNWYIPRWKYSTSQKAMFARESPATLWWLAPLGCPQWEFHNSSE